MDKQLQAMVDIGNASHPIERKLTQKVDNIEKELKRLTGEAVKRERALERKVDTLSKELNRLRAVVNKLARRIK